MTRKIFAVLTAIVMLLTAFPVSAGKPETIEALNPAGKPVFLPEHAIEVAPGVFSLGSAVDPSTGLLAEGLAIVHYKKGHAKGGSGKPSGSTACYGFLARGAKWKTVENWEINPSNPNSMDSGNVYNIFDAAVNKWEEAADGVVDNNIGISILGEGTATSNILTADNTAPDEKNEVYFGNLNDQGTIGVTTVWGYFGGPTQTRQLLEWDMVFNTQYDWSENAENSTTHMDFDNIATHELGHAAGLADLYTGSCSEETMYGYGTEGETKKRSLNSGDVKGISELY